MADSFKDVVEDTLEAAFGNAALLSAARRVLAPQITIEITQHAQEGLFLGGGTHDDDPFYSETTLPAFFLGDLQKSGGSWQLQSTELNTTVTPKDSDLIWRDSDGDGEPTALLLGGYKEFRRLSGRSTDFVNLTFTGKMLNSVRSSASVQGGNVKIETGATGRQQQKAGYTDAMYEWLGLFEDEQKHIKGMLEDWVDDIIDNRPDVTIKSG